MLCCKKAAILSQISNFFDSKVSSRIPFDNYVVDFSISCDNTVWIVELNPWVHVIITFSHLRSALEPVLLYSTGLSKKFLLASDPLNSAFLYCLIFIQRLRAFRSKMTEMPLKNLVLIGSV